MTEGAFPAWLDAAARLQHGAPPSAYGISPRWAGGEMGERLSLIRVRSGARAGPRSGAGTVGSGGGDGWEGWLCFLPRFAGEMSRSDRGGGLCLAGCGGAVAAWGAPLCLRHLPPLGGGRNGRAA